jgi:STE24 endopeptidase
LPWSIYEEWWREVFYEKSNQSFFDFLSQGVTSLLISVVGGGFFLSGIYFFIRKVGKYWWAWSSLLAAFSISAMMLLGPIWIEPLFNQYKPLPPGEVKEALTVLANQANIDPERIFVYDGSRQSNKFTANVTGIGSSARIAISDVALNSASLDEVKAVTAHEIGHYVLGHVWNLIGTATMLSLVFFYATSLIFPLIARWMGTQVTIDDPRGIPILLVCISLMSLLTQPINNFMIRKGETEADLYSYQAVNLPDAMATALVKTAEYRYPRPTPLQEFVFYSHPSVEKRVKAAMEWKSKNP